MASWLKLADKMIYIQAMGYVAGALVTFSFLPQVIKVWRTKQTRDLSLPMYVAIVTGTLLWFFYGIAVRQPPIWVANGVALCLMTSILLLKIRYG
ncbi:MAG TPA: SemiSWEET transporter [Candidatus Angelobacter sp.]|nr:SemiSWEET transporter [Candidatus Angelobacter sp.]